MRTKIGKRIGPVPIALVAVFALAAFISAGFWIVPDSAYAQSARASDDPIEDVVLDVGETMTINVEDAFDTAVPTGGEVLYTIASDQDDQLAPNAEDGTNGIETTAGTATGEISISGSEITLNAAATQAHAELADNTATITVTATVEDSSNATVATAEVEFDVTIVQNPIENNGTLYTSPEDLADGKCEVVANGDDLTTRLGDHDGNPDNPDTDFTIDGTAIVVAAGDCLSADDSVEVSFKNDRHS